MSHRIIRHPLDRAPPRLSDMPPVERRQLLLVRADAARDRWMRERQLRPLARRVADFLLPGLRRALPRPATAPWRGQPGAGVALPRDAGALSEPNRHE